MEQAVLSDKNIPPTEEVLNPLLGKTKVLWDLLFSSIHEDHPDFTEEWRYYMDGKRWLLKVCRKTKTIFWVSVVEGSFRTTFYFTDRAEEAISQSSLSAALKKQFEAGKHYNKIRGLTVLFKNRRDVDYARQLIEMKLLLK